MRTPKTFCKGCSIEIAEERQFAIGFGGCGWFCPACIKIIDAQDRSSQFKGIPVLNYYPPESRMRSLPSPRTPPAIEVTAVSSNSKSYKPMPLVRPKRNVVK